MTGLHSQRGFTVVELLVSCTVFLILAGGLFSVMMSSSKGSHDSRHLIHISEEARLALNRMVRDTRQGDALANVTPTSYNVRVDFNGDGLYQNPNSVGDFEDLTFSFDPGSSTITLNGETLIEGVTPIPGRSVFSYTSNALQYDFNQDGVTTTEELDDATGDGTGNNNNILDGREVDYVTSVVFAMTVTQGSRVAEFFGEAQLRNRR